ncbi:hypothetical protein U9M48_039898 [Paspalum notatum var. saurae]|uniref:Uncharacterized protein n=1 Tax=Paspalum notatum var. saurae TaxID=547442 RepID=A0AAQ3ULM7_PASNO
MLAACGPPRRALCATAPCTCLPCARGPLASTSPSVCGSRLAPSAAASSPSRTEPDPISHAKNPRAP